MLLFSSRAFLAWASYFPPRNASFVEVALFFFMILFICIYTLYKPYIRHHMCVARSNCVLFATDLSCNEYLSWILRKVVWLIDNFKRVNLCKLAFLHQSLQSSSRLLVVLLVAMSLFVIIYIILSNHLYWIIDFYSKEYIWLIQNCWAFAYVNYTFNISYFRLYGDVFLCCWCHCLYFSSIEYFYFIKKMYLMLVMSCCKRCIIMCRFPI